MCLPVGCWLAEPNGEFAAAEVRDAEGFRRNRKTSRSRENQRKRFVWDHRLQRAVPVAIDTPPAPQQMVIENHYVPYEQDSFAKAHAWASEQLVRKSPAAVEMLSTLDSLIRQQLNASER